MGSISLTEPTWKNTKDAKKYFNFRDNLQVLHFLMVLRHDYEAVHASILHGGFAPTLVVTVRDMGMLYQNVGS